MKIPVLDYGYVEFIEAWGHGKSGKQLNVGVNEDCERGIIEAARQSTQGSFRGWEPAACDCGWDISDGGHLPACASVKNPGDAKLLQFLYSHKHFTPFEFSGLIIEVQAPIFVFREWHRHRTQSYNEMSARYTPLPDLYYRPTKDRVRIPSGANKQAQGSKPVSEQDAIFFDHDLVRAYNICEKAYQNALAVGIPKELARLIMPVGHYSCMRASANLRNWLQFMTLRCAPEAQWEIRQFANTLAEIISEVFPLTFNLWNQSKEPNET